MKPATKIKINWREMMDRFGPEGIERAGWNSWAMAEGLATEDTIEHLDWKRAEKLGMSENEFNNRLPSE